MAMATQTGRPNGFQLDKGTAKDLRRRILSDMRTRSAKYRWWLLALSAVRFLFSRIPAEIFLTLYAGCREPDDITDGDRPLPLGFTSAVQLIERLIGFVQAPCEPRDGTEYLFAYAFDLASKIGIDIRNEVLLVLQSLKFDACRRDPRKPRILSRDGLRRHFCSRDINGVIATCLKLTGDYERGVRAEDLAELGEAVQIRYNLRDVLQDWDDGFCNIPLEAFHVPERSEINEERKLPNSLVERWTREEARRGLRLLKEYKRKLRGLPLLWRTRIALYVVFERPAKRYFARLS